MTIKLTADEIAKLRAVHAAWEPYLPSSHRDFEAAAREAFPALLDLAEEALRLRDVMRAYQEWQTADGWALGADTWQANEEARQKRERFHALYSATVTR